VADVPSGARVRRLPRRRHGARKDRASPRAPRRPAGRHGPSLVVVPRSLLFNWKDEAARFTPRLSVLDYSGAARGGTEPSRHDVVLTTYGTLKRDLGALKDITWDYVVLDEAQAVKNATTAADRSSS
jgi:SNF2 family DNA or RNA helicase